jgi:hypothetical protein
MTRVEAEAIFNSLLAHYPDAAPRIEKGRYAHLQKLERLDYRACAEACDEITVRSKRFPSLAEIYELTRAKERLYAPRGPIDESDHVVSDEEGLRRIRAILSKLKTAGQGVNPFLTPHEVWEIHRKWTAAWRRKRWEDGSRCACCTPEALAALEGREPGEEG